MDDVRNEFYEDDEPIEDVLAAFNAGDKGLTAAPYREATTSAPARLTNLVASPAFSLGRSFTRGDAGPVQFTATPATFSITSR